MKRPSTPLLLVLALLVGTAAAQPDPLPADERFDQPVEFSTDADGESLAAMVSALARSVGLTPVVDEVPDVLITYDIGEPKPFRQVWDLVLTLNDLDYELQANDVVVVGTEGSLAPLRGRQQAAADPDAETLQRFYRLATSSGEIVRILETAMPTLDVSELTERTIVVTATEEEHDRVVEILGQFDVAADEIPLEQRIYRLDYADAVAVADLLQSTDLVYVGSTTALGTTEADGGVGQTGGSVEDRGTTSRSEGRGEFTVVPDARTNSIIVTATPTVQNRIAQLIPELDQPQQQVNVQVRIQEINRRTASNLGINLAGAGGNFAANVLDGGLRFVFDAQSAVSGLNLGAVLDTLENQGLSRRVDDANITVLSDQEARMQSGGRIEIQYPSSEGELATRTIEFGVIITVTPRVIANGQVLLDVTAEISDVLVPVNEGGIPERIDFSEREISSTVTVNPGQTILLGGLLQNMFTQTESRVPVLGQLPLIGGLFGTTETEHENSELLLIVSANIVD